MSNSPCILSKLSSKGTGVGGWCSRSTEQEKHRPAFGKVQHQAAIYSFQLCKAILKGLRMELTKSGRMLGSLSILAPMGPTLGEERLEVAEELNQILASLQSHSEMADAVDSSTGQILKGTFGEGA